MQDSDESLIQRQSSAKMKKKAFEKDLAYQKTELTKRFIFRIFLSLLFAGLILLAFWWLIPINGNA